MDSINRLNIRLAKYSNDINHLDLKTFEHLFQLIIEHFIILLSFSNDDCNDLKNNINNSSNIGLDKDLDIDNNNTTLTTIDHGNHIVNNNDDNVIVNSEGEINQRKQREQQQQQEKQKKHLKQHIIEYDNNCFNYILNNHYQIREQIEKLFETNRNIFESIDRNLLKLLFNFIELCLKLNLKTKTIYNLLQDSHWSNDRIEIFFKCWQQNNSSLQKLLKTFSFKFSTKNLLKNLDYKLKLLENHSENDCKHMNDVNSQQQPLLFGEINFQFDNSNINHQQQPSKQQNLTLNFNHEELLKFYEQIEQIQNKIDKLY